MRYASAVAVCFLVLPGIAASQTPELNLREAIDRAQMAREERLLSYTVTEHYTLKNMRFGTSAELVANVTYSKESGKVYTVVSRTGSPFLQSKVLDRVLAEETAMSHGDARKTALVTSANYAMQPEGEEVLQGRRCVRVALTPRVKSTHLLKGKLWVDAETHNIVRIEGTPLQSPSFWAGASKIYRDYADIGEFAYAQRTVAVSGSMMTGKTEMRIEYNDYKIHVADSP
jgi:hypothetical protein